MDPWITRMAEFRDQWGLRITVYCSFGAHLILAVLARSRRRLGVCPLFLAILWLAYQIPDVATKYALGHLSLPGTDASSRQQQLIAFWAPFLLLHLGGPDNITAYSLEDNKLSWRKWSEFLTQCIGAFTVMYSNISLSDNRVLFCASTVMFIVGVAKYTERIMALYLGNPSNIRRPKKKDLTNSLSWPQHLDEEDALLFAHDNMFFWKHIMVDSAVLMNPSLDQTPPRDYPKDLQYSHDLRRKIFSLGWCSISKVVEMELSLIYDFIYTKANVIHTCVVGYLIRLISPVATAVALTLFCFYPKHDLKRVDVVFTYIMLTTTFFLDVVWLVRALGSSWSYAYLLTLPCKGLQHLFLCSGTWCWFHRVARSLDPCRLLGKDPVSYRRWSGITGQYNLLHECTRASCSIPDPLTWLAEKAGFDILIEYPYLRGFFNRDVRKMVLERIKQILPATVFQDITEDDTEDKDRYTMKEITTLRGKKAVDKFKDFLEAEGDGLEIKLYFSHEFQLDILAWHIGTCVFLHCFDERFIKCGVLTSKEHKLIKAIKLLSEHLMFLVAKRHDMLPGLAVKTLLEKIQEHLGTIKVGEGLNDSPSDVKLAKYLHKKKFEDVEFLWKEYDQRKLPISDGVELGIELLKYHQWYMEELLELIFNVWVDKLIYAGLRCPREAHAKQLARGGDLITIVWIIIEHAGTFQIDDKSGKPKEGKEMKKPDDAKPAPIGIPPATAATPPIHCMLPSCGEYPPCPMWPCPHPMLPCHPMPTSTPMTESTGDELPRVRGRKPRVPVDHKQEIKQLSRESKYITL